MIGVYIWDDLGEPYLAWIHLNGMVVLSLLKHNAGVNERSNFTSVAQKGFVAVIKDEFI